MTSPLLGRALETATDTRDIVARPGALAEVAQAFRRTFGDRAATIVADENTWQVVGEQVAEHLRSAGAQLGEPLVFPGSPTLFGDYEYVTQVRDHVGAGDGVPVVVGSGVLNDLTKLASTELERPYLCVATAASMDGYSSFGASITRDGFKITRSCAAPAAVVADLDVMAAAPARLTASGYGDLVEKIPAGADWLLADELGQEAVDPAVWELVQGPLREALADPAGCAAGNRDAIGRLAEALLMSGLAMQAHQSSRPASGAGHNFSHQWEMEGHGLRWEPPLSHGNKVGVGTVAICALYQRVLELDLSRFDVDRAVAAWPDPEANDRRVAALQPVEAIREAALAQSRAKYVTPDRIRQRIELVLEHWPTVIERIRPQLLPATEVAGMLRQAGAPNHPSLIGIDLDRLRTTYFQAQTLRSRYTVLDTLQELGLLGEVVDSLFTGDGYWAQHPSAG